MSTPQQYQQQQPQYAAPQGYPQPVQQPYPPQMQQPYPPQQYAQPQYQQPMPQQQYAPPAAPPQAMPANYQAPSADDFLMGGGGAPSAKFLSQGDTTAGRITERPRVEQQRDIQSSEKKFWNDGNPMMQLVVTVQTPMRDPAINEDDGRRRIFIKGAMKTAVQEAVGRAGARGLEVGGHLSITYTHDGEKKSAAMSAPKQYRAEYTSAANAELNAPAAPAAPQYQQPAPMPPQQPQYQQAPPQQQYAPQPMPPQAQQYAAPMPPQQVQQQPAPTGVSAEQLAAAQHDPAARALVQQIQGQQQTPAPAQGGEPPF